MDRSYYPCLLVAALLPAGVTAQTAAELDINNVRALFHSHGLVGMNPANSQPAFEVPQGSGTHALYSAGLWVGGLTNDAQLRLAAMKYEAQGEADYYPGPLTVDGSASTTPAVMNAYDHVWVVNASQVEQHIAYYQCLSTPGCDPEELFPGYTIPTSFFDWPAINTEPGFASYQAPFIDFNADGDYDPTQGDAPCILGDRALYFVFNDKGGPHVLTGSQPIGLEVQAMPFAYNSGDAYLDNTVFVHYHIINRGTDLLEDVRIGMFNDFDLGCGDDDLVGTHVGRNLTYVYNADDNDEACNGLLGYGAQPPAFGMVLLKGPFMNYDNTDNAPDNSLPGINGQLFGDGTIDNELFGVTKNMHMYREGDNCCNDASLGSDYFNYLHGVWKDGTPLTHGGNGYAPTNPNAVPTAFSFPGASDPFGAGTNGQVLPAWSEGPLTTPDRRTVTSAGPFTLEPGAHHDIYVAYVYARAAAGGADASVDQLLARVDSVQQFAYTLPVWNIFREDFVGGCVGFDPVGMHEETDTQALLLYPVPTSGLLNVVLPSTIQSATLRIVDALGRTVLTSGKATTATRTLDVTVLADGHYTVVAEQNGIRTHSRFVKEH